MRIRISDGSIRIQSKSQSGSLGSKMTVENWKTK